MNLPHEYRRKTRAWGLIRDQSGSTLSSFISTFILYCPNVVSTDRCVSGVRCHVFQGGVILVSHDERLIRLVCKELWVCESGKVGRIDGGFDEYRDILHEQFRKEGYLWGSTHCSPTMLTISNISPAPSIITPVTKSRSAVRADRRTFLISWCRWQCAANWLVVELWRRRRSCWRPPGDYLKSNMRLLSRCHHIKPGLVLYGLSGGLRFYQF